MTSTDRRRALATRRPGIAAPIATYRLQLNAAFGFAEAEALVPYLHALGITHIYASPIFKARRGSSHGYDVVDPNQINPEIGGAAGFTSLVDRLRRYGMGILLDVVPNHMAASTENPWWSDVLEAGMFSPHAATFDINWNPPRPDLKGRVLVPILGSRYGQVLYDGQLRLELDAAGFCIRYYEHRLPVGVETYPLILGPDAAGLGRELDRQVAGAWYRHLERVVRFADSAPRLTAASHHRRRLAIKAELHALAASVPRVQRFLAARVRAMNGRRGDPQSFEALDRLLGIQHYRLAYWRLGVDDGNYRRFFNITDLVSLRIEDPQVFALRHGFLLKLMRSGFIAGLRVDHIDGLADPFDYLERIRAEIGPHAYVIVEKILGADEDLPPEWPVQGTTGYDFLNLVNELLVDGAGCGALTGVYARFTGDERPFAEHILESKRHVVAMHFGAELSALILALMRLATRDARARLLPADELEQALSAVMICFSVYRTYVRDLMAPARERREIERAIALARRLNPGINDVAFDFVRRVLLLSGAAELPATDQADRLAFVMRWQQFTGPIMAKGVEDTAFYTYNRLLALNDVGGEPGSDGLGTQEFHQRMARRARRLPLTMNTTTTHDTKRGEDVRARLQVLSEMPQIWERRLKRWHRQNARKRPAVRGRLVPDRNVEAHIYQTLLGAWPLAPRDVPAFRRRVKEYLVKAAREAKVNSSWVAPDAEYEAALLAFTDRILAPGTGNRFLADFKRFLEPVARAGAVNGLAQVILRIAAPGVSDLYQGAERWDLRLVDPDNRGPVDFALNARLLAGLGRGFGARRFTEMRARWKDGAIKLHVLWKALSLRRDEPALFLSGRYLPLRTTGKQRDHICAFARVRGKKWALAIVPRLPVALGAGRRMPLGPRTWGATAVALPGGAPFHWIDALTGHELATERAPGGTRRLKVAQILTDLPVALLTGRGSTRSSSRAVHASRR